jgi:hypothetical protein
MVLVMEADSAVPVVTNCSIIGFVSKVSKINYLVKLEQHCRQSEEMERMSTQRVELAGLSSSRNETTVMILRYSKRILRNYSKKIC